MRITNSEPKQLGRKASEWLNIILALASNKLFLHIPALEIIRYMPQPEEAWHAAHKSLSRAKLFFYVPSTSDTIFSAGPDWRQIWRQHSSASGWMTAAVDSESASWAQRKSETTGRPTKTENKADRALNQCLEKKIVSGFWMFKVVTTSVPFWTISRASERCKTHRRQI